MYRKDEQIFHEFEQNQQLIGSCYVRSVRYFVTRTTLFYHPKEAKLRAIIEKIYIRLMARYDKFTHTIIAII
jgi:hypothetical protein